MAVDTDAKQKAIAEIIGGQVVDASERVAVCIKGAVNGLPATFEALFPGWPFGVMYMVESKTPNGPARDPDQASARITIYPRLGRGPMSFFTRLILFEAKGQSVQDRKLESRYIFSYDNSSVTDSFLRYPAVADYLQQLDSVAPFTELVIKTDAGVYLSQPQNFKALDVEVCRRTVKILGEIAQILAEDF